MDAAAAAARPAKVHPLSPSAAPRRSTRWRDGTPPHDDGDELALFSGMRNAMADVEAIEREVDAQLTLLDPFASAEDVARANSVLQRHGSAGTIQPNGDDEDVVVDAFVGLQPQYKQSVVAKKLQLYEKQLALRDRQLAALRETHSKALASIQKLKELVATQQKEFDDAQDEWEEEKESLLRFRGAGGAAGTAGAGTGAAMLFQMKMGVSAAAMAARSRSLNDAELQKQREMRLQMLRGAADVQDELADEGSITALTSGSHSRWRRLWKRIQRRLVRRLYPFASDVRQIEARFGYSVASYFRFFRWIIMSFVAISIPSIVALVLHLRTLVNTHRMFETNWAAFVGVFPAYLLLPMYVPAEGMVYTLVLLTMQLILLLFTILKWVAEDQQSKAMEAANAGSKQPKFARVVLNAWDFNTTSREQASDLKKAIGEQVKVTLREEELAETLRRRTPRERYNLYARRAAAFLLYLVIQAASWYLIIAVTTQSSEIQVYIAVKATFLAPYVSSIVPAVVTLINGVLPTVISQLTSLEKWDDAGFAIKAMVTRLYLAKVLNVMIQLVSYALLLDPYLFTGAESLFQVLTFYGPSVRKNVMLAFKPDLYTCRADQVASGLLTLVITDFTVGKVAALGMPIVAWSIAKAQAKWTRFRNRRQGAGGARIVPSANHDTLADHLLNEKAQDGTNGSLPSGQQNSTTLLQSLDEMSSTSVVTSKEARKTSIAARATSASETAPLIKKSEFQVPQKMVALLYSCTIALVAIPLAPTTAVLALLLHIINFKTDKIFLMHLQKKPANPWSAKDAGNFFIKFYFCTVVIFIAFTHFFLSNKHLPKLCDLQDSMLAVTDTGSTEELCLPGSYNSTTELCSLDPTLSKSSYFLSAAASSALSKNECLLGYPKCICSFSLACGPFVRDQDGYASLLRAALSVRGVAAVYRVVASSAFVAWVGVLASVMGAFFLRNSLRVQDMVAHAREHEVVITFASLRKKIKQLENRLRVHKISNNESTGGGAEGVSARPR